MDEFSFRYAERGLTRFPPNVELIRVEVESTTVWLMARRNDITLRFPLAAADCSYLATLLIEAAGKITP